LPSSPIEPTSRSSRTLAASCEELLAHVSQDDVVAFDALYRKEIGAVRGLAFSLLRDRFQADEVAQEVMLQIWQRAGQFDESLGSGHSWILRITRSRAIDRIRMCENVRVRDQIYADLDRPFVLDDVSNTVISRLETDRVRLALLEVSVIQREALMLAFFSCLAYPQIAERLDVPLGTLKSRIRDGLAKLRRILTQGAEDELREAA